MGERYIFDYHSPLCWLHHPRPRLSAKTTAPGAGRQLSGRKRLQGSNQCHTNLTHSLVPPTRPCPMHKPVKLKHWQSHHLDEGVLISNARQWSCWAAGYQIIDGKSSVDQGCCLRGHRRLRPWFIPLSLSPMRYRYCSWK